MSEIEIHNATREDLKHIDHGIVHYNNTQVPFTQEPSFETINRCIKEGDEVIGGVMAEVYCWNILHIDVLWVKDEYRGKGYATALMNNAENIARKMGCHISHLDTFDFQAKGLYEKLGYTVFGVLEDCPQGHNRYYMSKKL